MFYNHSSSSPDFKRWTHVDAKDENEFGDHKDDATRQNVAVCVNYSRPIQLVEIFGNTWQYVAVSGCFVIFLVRFSGFPLLSCLSPMASTLAVDFSFFRGDESNSPLRKFEVTYSMLLSIALVMVAAVALLVGWHRYRQVKQLGVLWARRDLAQHDASKVQFDDQTELRKLEKKTTEFNCLFLLFVFLDS